MISTEYLLIGKIFLIIFIFSCCLLFLSYFLNNQDSNFVKQASYECGFQPFEDARQSFNIEFFLVGILFVIFDLEIVFLFPLCLCIKLLTFSGALSAIFFLVVLTIDSFMNG